MEMGQPDHLDGPKHKKPVLTSSCGSRLVLAIFALQGMLLILSIHNLMQINDLNARLEDSSTNLTGKMNQLIRQMFTSEATKKIAQEDPETFEVILPGERMVAIKGVPLTFESHHVRIDQNHMYLDNSTKNSIVFNLGWAPAGYNDQNLPHTIRFSCRYQMDTKEHQDPNVKSITMHAIQYGVTTVKKTFTDDGDDFLRGSLQWSTEVKIAQFRFIPDFEGLVWDLSVTVFIGNEEIFELKVWRGSLRLYVINKSFCRKKLGIKYIACCLVVEA